MNIDIINKQIAAKTGVKESDVKKINTFYWRQVYNHLYSYNPAPVNIENVCVIHPDKKMVKDGIYYYIERIRKLYKSKWFKEGENSPKKISLLENYRSYLRKFWSIRKANKYTN